MSEGAPPKTKRNGARTFKNPPQPHMCIRDHIRDSSNNLPCYINVLSWDKVDMPASPNMPVPLYGGMKLSPPRTEDKNTLVFAVIANTEVLKMRGKNAKNPNEQASLIEVLLDFVETFNVGIQFKREYEILKDRDITGELKEVWILVQNQKEKDNSINPINQQETWIDGQLSTPQYTQCTDQQQQQQQMQQQQQQQQLQQQSQARPQQQHQQQPPPPHQQPQLPPQLQPLQQISQQVQQQQMQQNQQMMQNSYIMSQPPQYSPSVVYSPMPNECSNYDRYNYPIHNQDDQVYQASQMLVRTYNNSNGSRIDSDRYNYRERGRTLPQQPMPKQPPPPQQQPPQQQPPQQQNCPPYLASQYLFQQYAMDSNMGPNYGGQMTPAMNHFPDYIIMQHQHMASGMEQRQLESQMHAEAAHRMQQQQQHQQQQEQQMHVPPQLMQQPAPQYQPPTLSVIASHAAINTAKRSYYKSQHMGGNGNGGMSKNNMGKRQNNSPTHIKQGPPPTISNNTVGSVQSKENVADNSMKSKSPVKVLQRGLVSQNKQVISQSSPEKNSKSLEKNVEENNEACSVQVTDLDEEETKNKDALETSNDVVSKKPEALNYAAALKELKDLPDCSREVKTLTVENPTSSSSESRVQDVREVKQHHYNQKQRSIKAVLKRNNQSCSNDVSRTKKNGIRPTFEQMTTSVVEKLHDKGSQSTGEVNASTGWNTHAKQKSSDSPKRAQSTVNSIIKSVFKIHQGNNTTGDDIGTGKKQKSNGQVKVNARGSANEQEESNQGYTILKKSDVSTTMSSSSDEVVVNEIAQLSIQDCKDTTEMNAVLS